MEKRNSSRRCKAIYHYSSYLLLLGKRKLQSSDISDLLSKSFIIQKIYINVIPTKTSRWKDEIELFFTKNLTNQFVLWYGKKSSQLSVFFLEKSFESFLFD